MFFEMKKKCDEHIKLVKPYVAKAAGLGLLPVVRMFMNMLSSMMNLNIKSCKTLEEALDYLTMES